MRLVEPVSPPRALIWDRPQSWHVPALNLGPDCGGIIPSAPCDGVGLSASWKSLALGGAGPGAESRVSARQTSTLRHFLPF